MSFSFSPWAAFKPDKSFEINTIYWLAIGFIFAILSEVVQYFVPYRAFNINDLMANSVGVLAGSLVLLLPFKKQNARNNTSGSK